MYRKVLVPLDQSAEAEKVLPLVREEVAPDGEVILLHVLPPPKPLRAGGQVVAFESQVEESERARALAYLKEVALSQELSSQIWGGEVVFDDSVTQGILKVAQGEGVELIAMYTHDRKGLARFLKGSIAREVERGAAPIQVKVFPAGQLAATG